MSAGLASLFSDSAQAKFARVQKLDEFIAPPITESSKQLRKREKREQEEKEKEAGDPRKAEKRRKRFESREKARLAREGLTDSSVASSSSSTGKEEVTSHQDSDGSAATLEDAQSADHNERTVFIGNVSKNATVKSIKALCSEFGEVESVRLRSVPIAGTAVDEPGNQKLVKKVCVNSGRLGDQKGSVNAYVVFKLKESVPLALAANNRVHEGRHLRVDKPNPTLFDPQRSLFLGALPHYADEEELRDHFAKVLPNGHDDIESIRLIRDPETLVGKGIGYILLKDRDAVLKALSLHQVNTMSIHCAHIQLEYFISQLISFGTHDAVQVKFKKRFELRVMICGKRTKRTNKKQEAKVEKDSPSDGSRSDDAEHDGNDSQPAKKARWTQARKDERVFAPPPMNPAMKRIKHKSIKTRNKALIEKGQKKSVPGKKGKRLGGNVKKAMKAAKLKG
jgi:RNA recognition motif-containing protein